MKYLPIYACLLFTIFSFAQEESITIQEASEEPEEVSFAVIERVPVYPGCDETLSNRELKDCMSSNINNIILKKFNTDITKDLNLPAGPVRTIVIFKIDKEGNIVDIKARAPHDALEKEAIRVIKLLPKMEKPGMQRGKAVIVPYALPIVFMIEEAKPLSKKEQRKLKRKNRL